MPGLIVPDLFIEVTAANGTTFRWDANQEAGNRPFDLRFATKIGDGFADASLRLARRIDQDYPDLDLGNSVVIRTADGSIVYEGYIAAMPRDLGDSHWIGVTITGWMAHAKDRKFTEIYVDRSVSQWGEMPLEHQAVLLASGISINEISITSDQGGLVASLPNQALGAQTARDQWYQAPPGCHVASLAYRGTANVPVGYLTRFVGAADRPVTTFESYIPTFDDTLRTITLTTDRPYVYAQVYSNGTSATPAAGANMRFSKLAVYGNHTVTLRTGDSSEPNGVWVSDVIKDIARRFCSLLDTSGVQTHDYVIQHCAYRELTFPYDAFTDLNKYALWHLGVWENRTLTFRPYDFTRYDWEVRTDDEGTTFSPQGPSTESLYNGMQVVYTDPLTGVTDVLSPDAHAELRDDSSGNPWNSHQRDHWGQITLSTPVLQAQALGLGEAALGDANRPKTPGTLTVTGNIKDGAGNSHPVAKIRAGQMISITNFPNDDPRLIVETDYDAENGVNRLAIDKPFALLEAYLDRQQNALQAAGLI